MNSGTGTIKVLAVVKLKLCGGYFLFFLCKIMQNTYISRKKKIHLYILFL